LASISDPYASVAEYRGSTNKIDPDGDVRIKRDLVAVSRFLDERLEVAGTGFWCDPADAETSRIYIPRYRGDGYSPCVIDIQPVVSVSSVKVDTDADGAFDESAIDVANYRLLPLNATLRPAPKPYRKLEVTPWGSQGSWPATLQIQVTGRHGWPAVPEAIVVATIELTRLLRVEGPRATNRLDEGGVPLFLSRDAQARNIISDLIMTFHPTGGLVVA
jgi:hypothetical protein